MSAFKTNLEENEARRKYKSRFFWSVVLTSSFFGYAFLYMLGFSGLSLGRYILNIPSFSGQTSTFYFLLIFSYILLFLWWYGLPKVLSERKSIQSWVSKKRREGKKKTLHTFFYPEMILSDELVRAKDHSFFENDSIHIGNMFDYTAMGGFSHDKEGTNRIISLFRDSRNEELKKRMGSEKKKTRVTAEKAYTKRKEEYIDNKKPSPEQEYIYNDLFLVIGGMLEGYTSKHDRLHINHSLKSPIKVMIDPDTKKVSSCVVSDGVSVFKDRKVYFSITMLSETVKKVTMLYMEHTRLLLRTSSKLKNNLDSEILREENILQEFEDFFKFVYFRKLLKNYGSIPSGWMCVRIESYDLRAIFSAVDRAMIPVIPENEPLDTDRNSDRKAASFLLSYWEFMRSKEYREILEDIDWNFNTTVELNELTEEAMKGTK